MEIRAVQREFKLPTFSGSHHRVVSILVRIGDEVRRDSYPIEVETEKATVSISSPYVGIVVGIHVEVGQSLEAGQTLFTIAEDARIPELADHSLCPRCRAVPTNRDVVTASAARPEDPDMVVYLAECPQCGASLRRLSSRQPWEIRE